MQKMHNGQTARGLNCELPSLVVVAGMGTGSLNSQRQETAQTELKSSFRKAKARAGRAFPQITGHDRFRKTLCLWGEV